MRPGQDEFDGLAPAAAAAHWFVALQAADVGTEMRERFADWLRRSPLHVKEFLAYTALSQDLGRLPELLRIDTAALLREANETPNVVGIDAGADLPVAAGEGSVSSRSTSRRLGVALAAAAVLAAIGLGVARFSGGAFGAERYETGIGEQRSLVLADGSHVRLNVDSSLTARVNDAARDIRLDGGEALFEVAKDSARPFRVRTPQAVIEAVGTQFNVHVKEGLTTVALLEGRVVVRPLRDAVPVPLAPGQEITVADRVGGRPQASSADLDTATAWTKRRLVFEDVPLAEVVAEFNRYSRQPLVIDDTAVGDVRITASFDSGSTQVFAETLASAGGLSVQRRADGSWLIRR
jgi:transmembrane sensor